MDKLLLTTSVRNLISSVSHHLHYCVTAVSLLCKHSYLALLKLGLYYNYYRMYVVFKL